MVLIAGSSEADRDRAVKTLVSKMASASGFDLCWVFFNYSGFQPRHLRIIADALRCRNIIGSTVPFVCTKSGMPQNIVCVGFERADFNMFVLEDVRSSDAHLRLESSVYQMLAKSQKGKGGFLLGLFDAGVEYPPSLARAIQRIGVINNSFIGVASSALSGYNINAGNFLFNNRVLENAFVGIYLQNTKPAFAFASGFKPVGRSSKVTSYSRNVIKSIEGKPANLLYRRYFGRRYSMLGQGPLNLISTLYPLGFRREDRLILRSPSWVKADGSLVFWGDVPSSRCQFMISTPKNIIDATAAAFREAMSKASNPYVALIVDSAARFKVMRSLYYRLFEVLEDISASLPVVSVGVPYSICNTGLDWGYTGVRVLDHTAAVVILGRNDV